MGSEACSVIKERLLYTMRSLLIVETFVRRSVSKYKFCILQSLTP